MTDTPKTDGDPKGTEPQPSAPEPGTADQTTGPQSERALEQQLPFNQSVFGGPPSPPPSQHPFGTAVQGPPSLQIALQHGSMPIEVLTAQKMSGEQLLNVSRQQHELQHKKLDLEAQRIDKALEARDKREQREDLREQRSSARVERLAWGLVVLLASLIAFLLLHDKSEDALNVVRFAATHVFAIVGGMGFERWRQSKRLKRDREEDE